MLFMIINKVLFSVFFTDVNDELISASTVSWTGHLFYNNKFIAIINLVTYSVKKLFLPDYM